MNGEMNVRIRATNLARLTVHDGHLQLHALLDDVQLLLLDGQRAVRERVGRRDDAILVQVSEEERVDERRLAKSRFAWKIANIA